MNSDAGPSFDAYLDAKRALDDRSVHGPTWRSYLHRLRERVTRRDQADPPAVLELGCGMGSLLDRTVRDLDLAQAPDGPSLAYVAVDASAERLGVLRERFAAALGRLTVALETREGDALAILESLAAEGRRFDAVVSHAFADLVDLPLLCAAAAKVLKSGGCFYHSLVFDGITAFFPSSAGEAAEDGRYVTAYHASMARPWNGNRGIGVPADGASGRRLLGLIASPPWRPVGAGPSDWIILPRVERVDAASGEDAVVASMLDFFESSVGGPLAGRERAAFDAWLAAKRERAAAGELGFHAHHLDVLAVLGG